MPRDLPPTDLELFIRRIFARAIEDEGQTIKATRQILGALLEASPREQTHAAEQARRGSMLDEYDRLIAEGKGRSAATIAARKFARDPHDRTEVESNAKFIRKKRKG